MHAKTFARNATTLRNLRFLPSTLAKTEIMKVFKRKSKEYKQYVEGVIKQFNSNGKKTLLFVCDNAYPMVDGVWRVLDNCTEILQRDYPNYNVAIFAPDFKGEVYVKNVPVLGVRSVYLKSLHYQCALPMFDLQAKRWLKRLKIDLIHCHSPFLCGLLARKIHKKRKIPMISTFHSQFKKDFLKATNKSVTKVCMGIIMRVFNDSDEVWTMHSASRETLFSYGYNGKCRLMPNATPLKPLGENYESVREDFRSKHNIQGKTAFIFVGRLITQKGILFTVDVLAELKKQNVPFHMFFVGEGPDSGKLKNKIKSQNLSDEVTLVGEVLDSAEIAEYYAGADLFLFPSLYDVSSIVQIESATYKTPVVFVEGSVTSCTATNNVNGYVLPMDVQKFAQGVSQIIHGGTIKQVGENALRDLHVEWETVVAESAKVYDSFVNTPDVAKVK